MITDKLRSYGAAKRDIMPGIERRSHKGLNNRAENSHHRKLRAAAMQMWNEIARLQTA